METTVFSRRLKIGANYNRCGADEYRVAEIKLKGCWLEELGFLEGNYVLVTVEEGKLVLSLDPPPLSEETLP